MMENIIKLLKETDARISFEDRWLVWNEDCWQVFCHIYRMRNATRLYEGDDFDKAIEVLRGDDNNG